MDIATATPAEIDTELAKLDAKSHKLDAQMISAIASVHYAAGDRKGYRGNRAAWLMSDEDALAKAAEIAGSDAMAHVVESAKRALDGIEAARAAIAANLAEMKTLNDEFDRRGGWTRAFLAIVNGKGHVHSSMNCSTCNNGQFRTQFHWMTAYSDHTEAEVIHDAGERACTVCYPNAPVEDRNRPTKMFSQDEIDAEAAREERKAAKAARDAKRIAAAITQDGSELTVATRYGREHFKTERAATNWVVAEIGSHRAWNSSISEEGVRIVIEALAAKHETTVEEATELVEAKVKAWIKRNA